MTRMAAMENLDQAIIDLLDDGLTASEIRELVWETSKNWHDDHQVDES